MTYNFQKFEGRNVRLESRITITKSNSVGFPSKFYNDNGIKNYKYVIFYWDPENRAIGIKFTNESGERNKFSILHSKSGYGGSVVARSFFKSYDIDPKKYHGRYDYEKFTDREIGEIFVIKIEDSSKKEER